jgi:hypothetical protein
VLHESDSSYELKRLWFHPAETFKSALKDSAGVSSLGFLRRFSLKLKAPDLPSSSGGLIQQAAVEAPNVQQPSAPGPTALCEVEHLV